MNLMWVSIRKLPEGSVEIKSGDGIDILNSHSWAKLISEMSISQGYTDAHDFHMQPAGGWGMPG